METKLLKAECRLIDIPIICPDGEEGIVLIKFKDSADKKSSDNKVDYRLYRAFIATVIEAARKIDISEIIITSTTNGNHSAASRHYYGKALDIGGVNGRSIKDIGPMGEVKELQLAFDKQIGARENFGPFMMMKNGSAYIHDKLSPSRKAARERVKQRHDNHLHWSVN